MGRRAERVKQMQRTGMRNATAVSTVLAVVAATFMTLGVLVIAGPAAAATTNTLTLDVVSARTEPRAFEGAGVTEGDPVDSYKFIINEDNTGATDHRTATGPCSPSYTPPAGQPGYPASCPWTSINAASDAAPIVAQGDQDDPGRRARPARRHLPRLGPRRRLQARRRTLLDAPG